MCFYYSLVYKDFFIKFLIRISFKKMFYYKNIEVGFFTLFIFHVRIYMLDKQS